VHRRTRITVAAVAAVAVSLTLGAGLTGCSSSTTSATSGRVTVNGIKHLDVSDFAALTATSGTVLLDVRTPAEFAAGHLTGARNLDLQSADFDTQLSSLDHAATYAVYCHSGNRSGQALARMQAAGFTHAADLAGGITAWTADGQAITTT
jgi:rhodanese-related sulfurtransferase